MVKCSLANKIANAAEVKSVGSLLARSFFDVVLAGTEGRSEPLIDGLSAAATLSAIPIAAVPRLRRRSVASAECTRGYRRGKKAAPRWR
jgi:hypothetical protein